MPPYFIIYQCCKLIQKNELKDKKMTLNELPIGETGTITSVGGEGELRQHFLDMGVIPGAEVTVVKYAPLGDPIELRIHGYELTLRLADAAKISVRPIKELTQINNNELKEKTPHPGLGEGGKYHTKADENPLPEGTKLTFALSSTSTYPPFSLIAVAVPPE